MDIFKKIEQKILKFIVYILALFVLAITAVVYAIPILLFFSIILYILGALF